MAKSLLKARLSDTNNHPPTKKKEKKNKQKIKTNDNLLTSRISGEAVVVNQPRKIEAVKNEDNIKKIATERKRRKHDRVMITPVTKEKKKDIIPKSADYDEALDIKHEKREKKEAKASAITHKMGLTKKIIMIVCCVYAVFLIYGVLITDYVYDEQGNAIALEMTYSDLKRLDDFKDLVNIYYEMQELYKTTLDYDYELYINPDYSVALASDYEGLLEDVSKLSIQADATDVETAYSQVKSMMLSWIKSDIAVYLQNMSASISENNSEKASKAASDRERMLSNYNMITTNLEAIGSKVKGFDIKDISKWNPTTYQKTLAGN